MKAFLLELAANPQIPSFVLGILVPYLYNFLKVQGREPTTGQKYAFNVVLCIAAALLPVYAKWAVSGLPTPEDLLSSISAAFMASESFYRMYFKPKAEASA